MELKDFLEYFKGGYNILMILPFPQSYKEGYMCLYEYYTIIATCCFYQAKVNAFMDICQRFGWA